MADRPNQHEINLQKGKYQTSLRRIMDSEIISKKNKEDFELFIQRKLFVQKIGYGRAINLCSYFHKFCIEFFPDKVIQDLGELDYMSMTHKIEEGEILNEKDKPYTESSLKNFQRFFRSYLKTMIGDAKTEERIGRVKISEDKVDISSKFLTYEEVKQVVDKISVEEAPEMKFLIAFMFSTGCRAQDVRFLKMKNFYYSDENLIVHFPELKTFERDVALFLFKPEIEYYINEYLKKQKSRTEEDYLISYKDGVPAQLQTLNRKIKHHICKILGEEYKWVSSHKFRHSAAHYYSQFGELSYTNLCRQFAWSPRSRTPERYHQKKGIANMKLFDAQKKDIIARLPIENSELKERLDESENKIKEMSNKLNLLSESLVYEHMFDTKIGNKFLNEKVSEDIPVTEIENKVLEELGIKKDIEAIIDISLKDRISEAEIYEVYMQLSKEYKSHFKDFEYFKKVTLANHELQRVKKDFVIKDIEENILKGGKLEE